MKRVPGYRPLQDALNQAYEQSAAGKGKERHANTKPFTQQPIMKITREVGTGFPLGQAAKKIQESAGMLNRKQRGAAKQEILGAIVYLAAAVIYLEEQEKNDQR